MNFSLCFSIKKCLECWCACISPLRFFKYRTGDWVESCISVHLFYTCFELWIFSEGSPLVLCSSCPSAFHPACAKIGQVSEPWQCRDCFIGKRPLYGEVVWAKVGNYRWWPGEVLHSKNLPVQILNKVHEPGNFVVRLYGTGFHFWIQQGRCVQIQHFLIMCSVLMSLLSAKTGLSWRCCRNCRYYITLSITANCVKYHLTELLQKCEFICWGSGRYFCRGQKFRREVQAQKGYDGEGVLSGFRHGMTLKFGIRMTCNFVVT